MGAACEGVADPASLGSLDMFLRRGRPSPQALSRVAARSIAGLLAILAFSNPVPAQLIISEFLASNSECLADEDGDFPDWIEIYNPTTATLALAGWHLTDRADNLTRWTFPEVWIGPGEFLVVFASSKDRRDPGAPLHTDFSLGAGGEYLALVAPDGVTVSHHYAPAFPEQLADVSYGLAQYVTTLVTHDDAALYHVPTAVDAPLGSSWFLPEFDDSTWFEGTAALGFGGVGGAQPVGHWPFDSDATDSGGHYDGALVNGAAVVLEPRPGGGGGDGACNGGPSGDGGDGGGNTCPPTFNAGPVSYENGDDGQGPGGGGRGSGGCGGPSFCLFSSGAGGADLSGYTGSNNFILGVGGPGGSGGPSIGNPGGDGAPGAIGATNL